MDAGQLDNERCKAFVAIGNLAAFLLMELVELWYNFIDHSNGMKLNFEQLGGCLSGNMFVSQDPRDASD